MRTTTRGKLRDGTRRDLQGGGQGAGARAPERKDDGVRRRGQLRRGLLGPEIARLVRPMPALPGMRPVRHGK
jgi:hypothetical protein